MIEEISNRINALISRRERVIAAIDGRCGSGKTTAAEALKTRFECIVIHMDDFFLRPCQRTSQRLAVPGENVDHERFLQEVLIPLSKGESFCYRPFNCAKMELDAPVCVEPGKVVIIEGSYCCHRDLRGYYDLKVFLDIDADVQRERIIRRNGEGAEMFFARWIPLEEAYFEACRVKECCDLVLKST